MTQPLQGVLVEHAVLMLRPLTDAADDDAARERLLDGIGWNLSALAGFDLDAFVKALRDCRSIISGLAVRLQNGLNDLSDAVHCFNEIRSGVTMITALLETWRGGPPPPGGSDDAPPSLTADPYLLLLSDLTCYLLDGHLATHAPTLRTALDVLGVRTLDVATEELRIDGVVARDARSRPFYTVGPITDLLSDPVGVVKRRVFGPSGPAGLTDGELADAVGRPLTAWLNSIGVRAAYGTAGADAEGSGLTEAEAAAAAHLLHLSWFARSSDPEVDPSDPSGGVAAGAGLSVAIGLSRDPVAGPEAPPLAAVIAPRGTLEAHVDRGMWVVDSEVTGTVSPVVVSRHGARFVNPDGTTAPGGALDGRVEVTYGLPVAGQPALRIGTPGATRVEIDKVRFRAHGRIEPSGATGEVSLVLEGSRLVIEPGTDGFLSAVLPKQSIVVALDAGLTWSPERGLTFTGGAGLTTIIPVGMTLGPLTISQVTLALRAGATTASSAGQTGVEVGVGTDLRVRLGPVTATVTGLGLRAALTPAKGGGTLGPFDLDVAFQPPSGIGIAVESDLVKGGGYLFAEAGGQYGGVIQLKFLGLSLSAIGLLNTRMPDGTPGFSLLILVSVRFPPVQLGFGFSLTGVGGLIGINRAVDVKALRGGLANGALDSVLFPADPVANAGRLVRDLNRFFPTTAHQHVIGPTVELTWGAQGMLTARLGLFFESPSPVRVVLAGQLRLALPPAAPEPVVLIQVDLVGSLDFSGRTLAIDGVLRDSRIAAFTLTGRLAVRASWGDDPGFVVAIGGFNPRFPQPANFPVLPRVTLALGDGDNPRLRLAAYLALTSNTVQFGARLDIYASISVPLVGKFEIAAIISFDALVVLDPLSFIVDIYAMVALTWDGDPVFAVQLEATLSGPRPWRAVGTASFRFLGHHSISFDVTVGRKARALPPVVVDIVGKVRAALALHANWSAERPAGDQPLVTLAETAVAGADTVLVHPLGSLTVRQKIAPLNLTIHRYGTAVLAGGPARLTLDAFALDGADAGRKFVDDLFAPAEYLEMGDMERLSAPSFESWNSGVTVPDAGLKLPATTAYRQVPAVFEDEIVTRTAGTETVVTRTRPIANAQMRLQAAAGASAVKGATAQGAEAFAGPSLGIELAEALYAVVTAQAPDDGAIAVITTARPPTTFAAAREEFTTAAAAADTFRLIENDDVPRE